MRGGREERKYLQGDEDGGFGPWSGALGDGVYAKGFKGRHEDEGDAPSVIKRKGEV